MKEIVVVHPRDVLIPFHEGEDSLKVLAEGLDLAEVDRPCSAFQAMDPPVDRLDQLRRETGLLELDQPSRDRFEVFIRLLPERLEEAGTKLFVRPAHGTLC